jgi:glutaredoxin
MASAEHTCPYGIKARDCCGAAVYAVEDRLLTSRAETDAFKAKHQVATTPQVFIGGERIGGYDDLPRGSAAPGPTHKGDALRAVAALFGMAAAMAVAASYAATGSAFNAARGGVVRGVQHVLLALMKLRDVGSFATMFLGYDLLAQRWVPYATLYPFAEGLAGMLMVAGVLMWFRCRSPCSSGASARFRCSRRSMDRRSYAAPASAGQRRAARLHLADRELMMIAMAVWMLVRPHG